MTMKTLRNEYRRVLKEGWTEWKSLRAYIRSFSVRSAQEFEGKARHIWKGGQ